MARSATRSTAEAGDMAAVRARLALIAFTDAVRGKEKIARHSLHEESRYAMLGSTSSPDLPEKFEAHPDRDRDNADTDGGRGRTV